MSYILLVEDDLEIAENVNMFLQASDFETIHLASGENVVETVKKNEPSLILLDVMLPVLDGITCCKKIREFSDVPIILITAQVEERDRIVGLGAGADDYVCKPFSAIELVLRIKAILRRVTKGNQNNVFKLDKNTFEISFKEHRTELTGLEFTLFELLYSQPGRIYSRQQLLDQAYPDIRDISDRTIDSHIKNIRKKIKTLDINNSVIESVYGAGYRFIVPE